MVEQTKAQVLEERRALFQKEVLGQSYEDLLSDKMGLGSLMLLGGYHSGEAYKKKCAELTDHLRSNPGAVKEPWVEELWDEEKKEVVPRRRVLLYRYSSLPAVWDEPDEEKAKIKEAKMTAEDKDKGRMHFARLMASSDNMFLKQSVDYDANTFFLLVMIMRKYFNLANRPSRASGRATHAKKPEGLMETKATKSYNEFRMACITGVENPTVAKRMASNSLGTVMKVRL
jgi:hypothetical protein